MITAATTTTQKGVLTIEQELGVLYEEEASKLWFNKKMWLLLLVWGLTATLLIAGARQMYMHSGVPLEHKQFSDGMVYSAENGYVKTIRRFLHTDYSYGNLVRGRNVALVGGMLWANPRTCLVGLSDNSLWKEKVYSEPANAYRAFEEQGIAETNAAMVGLFEDEMAVREAMNIR